MDRNAILASANLPSCELTRNDFLHLDPIPNRIRGSCLDQIKTLRDDDLGLESNHYVLTRIDKKRNSWKPSTAKKTTCFCNRKWTTGSIGIVNKVLDIRKVLETGGE